MKIAIYPGSFDPITNGHLDVLGRAAQMFDKVIILVAINSEKKGRFPIEERVAMIKESISQFSNVEVDSYDGLTVEYAKAHNSKFLIRGLRAVTDFDYEFQLAAANEYADPSIDTVFLMSKAEKSFINSSAIIELAKKGLDVSGLVPPAVVKRLK